MNLKKISPVLMVFMICWVGITLLSCSKDNQDTKKDFTLQDISGTHLVTVIRHWEYKKPGIPNRSSDTTFSDTLSIKISGDTLVLHLRKYHWMDNQLFFQYQDGDVFWFDGEEGSANVSRTFKYNKGNQNFRYDNVSLSDFESKELKIIN